jgi:hypothetical protein
VYEALSEITYYFPVDCDHDISTDTLKFALTAAAFGPGGTGSVNGTYVPAPSAFLQAATPKPATGLTRYWWSILLGPGGLLAPQVGTSTMYGQLADSPNLPILDWRFTIRN